MAKIPSRGISDPFPGVSQYLQMTDEERNPYNRSKYNKSAREVAAYALEYLILFSQRQREAEILKAIDERDVRTLIETLTGNGCDFISPRHYRLCKSAAQIAFARLRGLVDPTYSPTVKPFLDQALVQLTMLQEPSEPRNNPDYKEQRKRLALKIIRTRD